MLVDTVLYNTKIFTNGKLISAGLAINEGKIVKIAKKKNLPNASKTINLDGKIILPGLIDAHVHLRDQKLSYKENFITGTSAAAIGGITSVIDMPNNSPLTNDLFSLKKRIELAKKSILVNVAFNCVFPKKINEIPEIIKGGAVGFKIYLSNNISGLDFSDDKTLKLAIIEATKNGVPVSIHAEDKQVIDTRINQMKKAGKNDIKAYCDSHPVEAEVKSIKRILRLIKNLNVKVHFCHLSSADGLQSIIKAKLRGLAVTCEVTPHHLFLSSKEYQKFGFLGLTAPPLRTKEDNLMLWTAIKFGFIDLVASDHAPHSLEEKNGTSVWETKYGVPGLETTLPLLLTKVNNDCLSLAELVRLTSKNPARIFCLQNRGSINVGNWADLVIVDMKLSHKVNARTFLSKAKYSPFDGISLKGKVIKTYVNGKLVMENNKIVNNSGVGKIINFHNV